MGPGLDPCWDVAPTPRALDDEEEGGGGVETAEEEEVVEEEKEGLDDLFFKWGRYCKMLAPELTGEDEEEDCLPCAAAVDLAEAVKLSFRKLVQFRILGPFDSRSAKPLTL